MDIVPPTDKIPNNILLTTAVTSETNSEFIQWRGNRLKTIRDKIDQQFIFQISTNTVTPLSIPTLSFDNKYDNIQGLGILIHHFSFSKIEITSFLYNSSTKQYKAKLLFTFHDDFGLDAGDVNRQYFFLQGGFESWYILQHYRCYRPFMVEVTYNNQDSPIISGIVKP
jgi:hypothetical protein